MPFHAALVAAIFTLTLLGFLGVVVLSARAREGEQEPGERPLSVFAFPLRP